MTNLIIDKRINEIKNQHIHVVWGFISSGIAYMAGCDLFFLGGLAVGIVVELYQFFIQKERLKLLDRALDLTFWAIGGIFFLVVKYGICG